VSTDLVPGSVNAHQIRALDLENLMVSAVTDRHPEVSHVALRLAINLKRAATILLQREESDFLGVLNRSTAAVRALTMIWMFEPVEARDIARLSGYSRQAVSGVLTTLERDGLITRERGSSSDRRLAPVSITTGGRTFVEDVLPRQNVTEGRFFGALSESEQEDLGRLLAKLVTGTVSADEDLDDPNDQYTPVPGG
jgi:DNA-binding MarR family transcriptional regulator